MGFATIVSGGAAGRYTIRLDYGAATRTRILAAMSLVLARIETDIATAQALVDAAKAKEDDQAARYEAAVDTFIEQHRVVPPGAPRPDDRAVIFEFTKLRELELAHAPLRANLTARKFDRTNARLRVAYWEAFNPIETRQAWCVDYTTDRAPGTTVATIDIPGDSNLLLLDRGARAWNPNDGQLVAREIMSPEQAFFNEAILPGWQIDAPTYRWGTVTGINRSASTLNVTLAPATSSAQRLNINRETNLAGVPVNYMNTGAFVFRIDDRVVVKFENRSWNSPRVLGFLDNPRLPNWTCVHSVGGTQIIFLSRDSALMASLFHLGPLFEFRFAGGEWQTLTAAALGDIFYDGDSLMQRNRILKFDDLMGNVSEPGFVILTLARNPPSAPNTQWIMCAITPSGPVTAIPRPFSARRVGEFRVKLAGETVFNAAIKDSPWSGEGTANAVMCNGGLNIGESAEIQTAYGGAGGPVSLLDYTLAG